LGTASTLQSFYHTTLSFTLDYLVFLSILPSFFTS
jgi:hypothetical protein